MLAVALRAFFFSGYPGTDDTYYIEAAYRVSVGDLDAFDSHFAVRSGLVLPTAAAYASFGVSAITTTWLPFVSSLLAVVTAFLLGRQVFDVGVGLTAALLLAWLPLDVIFASQLFACAPVGFLAGLTAFCLVRDRTSATAWWALCAGVVLGLATLCADVAWFILLPAGYHFAVRSPRRGRLLVLVAGLALVVGVETLFYAYAIDDPLRRWRLLARAVSVQGSDALSSGVGVAYLVQPFLRLVTEQEFGLFPVVVAPVLLLHLLRPRSPDSRFLVFWVVVVFLYTAYGTTSPFRFAPLPRLPRYLSTIAIPALVLLGAQLNEWRPPTRRLLVSLLAVTSLLCVWIDNGRAVKAPRKALLAFTDAHPGTAFVLEPPLLFDVLYFRGFHPRTGLSALAVDTLVERHLESRRSVYVGVPLVGDLREVHHACVVRSVTGQPSAPAGRPDATLAASFAAPDRLYYRFLRHPLFRRVLAMTRDRHRVDGLQSLSSERVEVHCVP